MSSTSRLSIITSQEARYRKPLTQLLLRHQFIYPATPWMSWSHSSTLTLKVMVLVSRSASPDWPGKSCFNLLNRGIWRSSISLSIPTKVQLYHTYSQPVLLYGSETWAITRALRDKVDAFDNKCLRRILRIPYTDHVTNATVRLQAGSPPHLSRLTQARDASSIFRHVSIQSLHQRAAQGLETPTRSSSSYLATHPGSRSPTS